MPDLTTIDAVKLVLVPPTSNQDALIGKLITRESRLIEQWCGRSSFSPVPRTDQRMNGTGTAVLPVTDVPIISISSLKDGNTTIAASVDGGYGYVNDDSRIYLIGSKFSMGLQNITCSYRAGYEASESGIVPANTPYTVTPTTGGTAISATGVANANTGAPMTQVSNAPATGQFSFANGTFSFASADANLPVTMTYGYVPPPVEQACIEMVGLDLRARDNLGVTSKTLAGETITYSSKGITDSVKEQLMPYRRMTIA